ncbi:MAG: MFS transporter, partial [Mobilitalea sp.]
VYNCVLATGNRWFAKNAGMMSGIFLMCFGAGSLIFGPLSTALMKQIGWSKTFIVLGILFAIVFTITSFQVVLPKESLVPITDEKVKGTRTNITTTEMLKHKNFWFYLGWSTLFSAVGLGLVGQVFTISSSFHMSDMNAAYMVSLVAVCNGLGRFFFGSIYDIKGRNVTMTVISFITMTGVVLLSIAVKNNLVMLLFGAFIFMGFGYGGITPNNSNFIRDYFGVKNYAMNFSIVNFNLLISVFIGQGVGSSLYMMTGAYFYSAVVMLVLCITGFVCSLKIKAYV